MAKMTSKIKRRIFAVAIASSIGILISANPAKAQFNANNLVNQIIQTIAGEIEGFIFGVNGNPFSDFLAQILGENKDLLTEDLASQTYKILEELSGAGDEGEGEKKTPDYLEVQNRVANETQSDIYGLDASVTAQLEQNRADRALTKINIQSLLGEEASEGHEKVIETTVELTADASARSERAQSLTVTQDIMKELVAIQANQTRVMAEMRAEMLQQRIDNAYSNANLVNISQTMDAMHRAETIRNGSASAYSNIQTNAIIAPASVN